MKKLLVLSASGGLDSSTMLYKALNDGFDVITLGFNYSQKNEVELIQRKNLLEETQKNFLNYITDIPIDLNCMMEIQLNTFKKLRESQKIKEEAKHEFYMPSRNLLFAVISTVFAEISAIAMGYDEVYIGLGIHKHSEEAYGEEHRDYWDITPEFAKRLQYLLELNDVKKINLYTPFVEKTKEDIVKLAIELGLPYKDTWTCYNPSIKEGIAIPCLECEACIERELAGKKAGITDINAYHCILEEEEGIENE